MQLGSLTVYSLPIYNQRGEIGTMFLSVIKVISCVRDTTQPKDILSSRVICNPVVRAFSPDLASLGQAAKPDHPNKETWPKILCSHVL